jgi:hypothetical protein
MILKLIVARCMSYPRQRRLANKNNTHTQKNHMKQNKSSENVPLIFHSSFSSTNDTRKIPKGQLKGVKRRIGYHGQKIQDKRTNNDLLNTTQKPKDQATRIPLKTGGEHQKGKQFLFHLLMVILLYLTDRYLYVDSMCVHLFMTYIDI